MRPIKEIIIHCTATPLEMAVSVDDIRRWHLKRNFSDIGYHYIIYQNGSICSGRPLSTVGAHCKGHNRYSIGVCYVGGLGHDGKPSDTRTVYQKAALIKLLKYLISQYHLSSSSIHGHNEFANKACPCFNVKSEYLNL